MLYQDTYDENDPNYPPKPSKRNPIPWHKRYPKKAAEGAKRWQDANPERVKETRQKWAARHAASLKERNLISRFKRMGVSITLQQYTSLKASQNNICAICQQPQTKLLVLDHDHVTLQPRQLLCYRCNLAVGWAEIFKREPDLSESVQNYLQKYQNTP